MAASGGSSVPTWGLDRGFAQGRVKGAADGTGPEPRAQGDVRARHAAGSAAQTVGVRIIALAYGGDLAVRLLASDGDWSPIQHSAAAPFELLPENPASGSLSRRITMRIALLFFLAAAPFVSTGCSASYYAMMEKLGVEKRDLLVDRVKDARTDQVDAQEQFKTTLEAFQELTGFDGGSLEKAYKKFNGEYEDSVDAAEDVSDRIEKVQEVAKDMFSEWETELGNYTDDAAGRDLRQRSETQLSDTRTRYDDMMRSMESAERSMAPVLAAFKNQVTYLKHSLNAQALASLDDVKVEIENNIGDLISNMERSIAEAESFINEYERGSDS